MALQYFVTINKVDPDTKTDFAMFELLCDYPAAVSQIIRQTV